MAGRARGIVRLLCATPNVLSLFLLVSASSAQTRAGNNDQWGGCGTIETPFVESQCQRLIFGGEILAGQTFERKLGGNLVFRLNPQSALSGWTIEVVPEKQVGAGGSEYVWVVNAPYRSYNVRDLDTSYGTSAKDAVAFTPREFNFVLSDKQYEMAAHLVDLAIMSRPQSDQRSPEEIEKESLDSVSTLMKFPVAKGRLWILDSKIKKPSNDSDPGTIEWIKFRVELHVPCGFRVLPEAKELYVDSSACAALKGPSAD